MYYSAESVIAALKANNTLTCEGEKVKCPTPCPCSPVHEKDCLGDPSTCCDCLDRRCEQQLPVHRNNKKMRILVFWFAVSAQNNRGVIHQTDSVLLQFIRKKLIDKNKLEPVTL
jgi:hypothetical protein